MADSAPLLNKAKDVKSIQKKTVNPTEKCLKCTVEEASTRKLTHLTLEGFTPLGKFIEMLVLFLILGNVGTFIISTEPFITPAIQYWFDVFETVTVLVFTVEFFLRAWSVIEDPTWNGRCHYFFSFYSIVDFLAVFPWWIDLFTPDDYIPTTFVRILRLFRLFKAEHYVEAFTVFDNVFARHSHLLQSTGFIALILWVIMSCLFYYSERGNPNLDGQFDNIPSAMFFTAIFFNGEWAYTDFYITGKLLGAFMALLGIALFAIPIGILTEGFEAITNQRKEAREKLLSRARLEITCYNADCSEVLTYEHLFKRKDLD